jgi:hypothetical protein
MGKMSWLWFRISFFAAVIGLFLGGTAVKAFGNHNMAITLIVLVAFAGLILGLILARQKAIGCGLALG